MKMLQNNLMIAIIIMIMMMKVCEEIPSSGYGAKPETVCTSKPVEECGTVAKTVYVSRCIIIMMMVINIRYKKLPDTTCERLPFEACAPDNCEFVPGPAECHNSTVDIGIDKPEEVTMIVMMMVMMMIIIMQVCDLQPQKMCKQVYRLVPKLYPQEICEEVPREVKTVHVYICRPLYLYTCTPLLHFSGLLHQSQEPPEGEDATADQVVL